MVATENDNGRIRRRLGAMGSGADRPGEGRGEPGLRPLPWCPLDPPPLAGPGARSPSPPPGAAASPPPTLLLLDRRQVVESGQLASLEPLLDPEERLRHQAFRLPEDRQRHLLGRAGLRLVLSAWLDRHPRSLRFSSGPHGKPELVDGGAAAPHFNLAHSGDLILLALHPDRPVGVDVERQRPDLDWRPIARRLFPPAELAALEAVPSASQADAFLRHWCRLEARLKASGDGLAGLQGLRQGVADAPEIWDVQVPEGYRAAVALLPPRLAAARSS